MKVAEWHVLAADDFNLLKKLLEGGPLGGLLVNAVHDQVAELRRIATVLDILHCVDEERLMNGEGVEIIAVHAFTNGGYFKHGEPHHKNLTARASFQGIEELDPQEF